MKRVMYIIIFMFSFFAFCNVTNASELKVNANNIVMYNLNDNNIIYQKNKDDKVYIASLTKIMTILVTLENVENLDDKVIITNEMLENTSGYAVAGLEVGDELTYKDLIYTAYLKSAADAVNALVISVAKDEDKFINLMNSTAKDLKLKNTKFNNAIGKDSKNNYSTADDIAKLIIFAFKNEDFKKMWETKKYKLNADTVFTNSIYGKVEDLKDKDFKTDYITGSKAGYTDKAKNCLSSTAKIEDVEYLVVTMDNEEEKDYSVKDAVALYKYYSSNYSYQTIISLGQKLTTIKVKNSPKKIDILETKAVNLYLPNTLMIEDLQYEYTGKTEVSKNTPIGTKLGTLKVKNGDKVLYKEEVKLNKAVGFVFSYYYFIHIAGFILLCILIAYVKKKTDKH